MNLLHSSLLWIYRTFNSVAMVYNLKNLLQKEIDFKNLSKIWSNVIKRLFRVHLEFTKSFTIQGHPCLHISSKYEIMKMVLTPKGRISNKNENKFRPRTPPSVCLHATMWKSAFQICNVVAKPSIIHIILPRFHQFVPYFLQKI